jgi:hypothetical protein
MNKVKIKVQAMAFKMERAPSSVLNEASLLCGHFTRRSVHSPTMNHKRPFSLRLQLWSAIAVPSELMGSKLKYAFDFLAWCHVNVRLIGLAVHFLYCHFGIEHIDPAVFDSPY